MPERAASVPYNPVPTVESQGNLGGGMNVRATPEDFGALVAKAGEAAGNEAFELAKKQQGMINETAMTNADAAFATKVGEIKGKYTTLTGQAAYDAFPQYQQDIKTAFQASRAALPPMAQRGFDMMATRTMANHIADGSSYASSQLKEANRDAYSNLVNPNLQALLDPQVAANKERSDYHLDTLKYAAQAQMDENHPGLKKDPETGTVNFDESTLEGQSAKAQFQQRLDTYLTQGYVNRYDTLAKHNVFGAYDQYQQERDKLTRSAQVALDASFAPRIFDAHAQTATGNTLTYAAQEHYDMLTNPARDSAINTVMKNEGGLSPDGHAIYGIDKDAHPAEYAKALAMPEAEGREYAKQFYRTEYYDKKGIANLPPETQSVVMDGVVNHTTDFGNKLIQAAKDGATPQQLIDMRRTEYQRVAQIPGKEQFLTGWNNRLDNLQQQTEGKKTYATNENGAPLSLADYYRTHSQDVLARGDAYAETQMPGDLALKRAVRQTLENYMTKTISNENAAHGMDNRNIMKAINGDLTKGKPPETEAELRAIPSVAPLLDKVATQDPKFLESIPTLIGKVARRNDVTNSANGYDTITRTLQPHDTEHPNAIAGQDHLDRLLGRSDGTGINMKDYNDAKPATELDSVIKEPLLKHMQQIAIANGNLDGKGQQRAIQWYNQTMAAWKQNASKGDKGMPAAEFASHIGEAEGPLFAPPSPSRMTQIANWAKEKTGLGAILVKSADGTLGTIPAGNIEKALLRGYTKVE